MESIDLWKQTTTTSIAEAAAAAAPMTKSNKPILTC